MGKRIRITFFLAAMLLAVWGRAGEAAARQVTIAVVQDGPSADLEVVEQIRPELEHLLGSGFRVVFKRSPAFDARWEPGRFRRVVLNAMRDRAVDLVLGVGILVTQEAARPDLKLVKPFVSATVLNGDIPKLPYSPKDHSLKRNLSVVVLPQRAEEDIRLFRRMVRFTRLHVGICEVEYENLTDLKAGFQEWSKRYGVEIIPFPITRDLDETASRLDSSVQAFYLIHLPHLTHGNRKKLIDLFNARKIPTFTNMGPPDVKLGALATNRPDIRQQVVRRVAMNLYQLIGGASTKELRVLLAVDSKLLINARTAVMIGYRPDFETRMRADFIHPEAFTAHETPLDFHQVFQMAEKGNVQLSISDARLETAMREKQQAWSPLLPHVSARSTYSNINVDGRDTILPENVGRAGLAVDQMVFDDESISSFRSSTRTYQAARFRRESDQLDIYQQAGQAFLSLVRARVLARVQMDNLKLTEGNLDLARIRVEVGQSGKDELYRWEAELANQRSLLLQRESRVESERIALNQVLGVEQAKSWAPKEIEVKPGSSYFLGGRLDFAFQSPETYDRFREAVVRMALENSPEIRSLAKRIESQKILVGQRKRSFFLPKIGASLSYDYNFWQSPDHPDIGDDGSLVQVTATLPLLEGTRRISEVKKQQSVLNELNRQMALTRQLVEKRARTVLRRMESSFPNIAFSLRAAENAGKNLNVVRDKYAYGIVSITDLLEAQTTSFSASQAATEAVYRFLDDLVEFQRALAFFEAEKTPEEIEAFVTKIRSAMQSL